MVLKGVFVSKNLFLCALCREKIPKVSQALYVDQSTNRPFCSETCIMKFHAPYMESFEIEELEERQRLGLGPETDLDMVFTRHDLFQQALNEPDEVWFEKNPIGEEYHTHVARCSFDGTDFFYILVCSYFDDAPSFVFFKCATVHGALADFYRSGQLQSSREKEALSMSAAAQQLEKEPAINEGTRRLRSKQAPEVEIPPEVLEDLDLKKSEYLAALLQNRKDEDIPFEMFGKYDDYLALTIEDPDEIYSKEDKAGDEVQTYIKSFQAFGEAFFYVAICVKISVKKPEDHEALLPILTFPSTDQDLYKAYALGERIAGALKS